jgi:hypothetical protein
MIPILKSSVSSPNPRIREGGCLALSEILYASSPFLPPSSSHTLISNPFLSPLFYRESAAPAQLEEHQDAIISAIRTALVDENAIVRAAAAQTFDAMQQSDFGTKAIDQTIPTLLEALRQPGDTSETALYVSRSSLFLLRCTPSADFTPLRYFSRALKEVMSVRANSIFPVVIPTLIAIPISAFNARALGSLVSVAGNALSRRLIPILTALVKSIETEKDEEILEEIQETTSTLLRSVEDIEGLNTLLMQLLGWSKSDSPQRRVSAVKCL